MARSHGSVNALRRIMQDQLAVGKLLLTLAEESEQAIIDGNAARLEKIVPEQHALLARQTAQENARQQVTREICHAVGMERVPTLSVLLPALSVADASALSTLRQQILETERRMEALNRGNRQLLDNALNYVKFSMDVLTSAALKPARYGVNLAQISAPSFYIDSKA